MDKDYLILKRASASRPSGEWNDEDYDVVADGVIVGRIISAAAVTVLTILVITDLTTGTGRFNLVRGTVGTLIAIAASISTTATGFIFEGLGHWEGFLILAAVSAGATALLWAAMPETMPAKYLD